MERFFYVNEFFDRKVFYLSAVRQSLQIFLYIMKRKGCPDWEWKNENV